MPRVCRAVLIGTLMTLGLGQARGAEVSSELVLEPGTVELRGIAARQQLIATETVAGRPCDRTRQVTWRSETPAVVSVDADGVAHGQGDGVGQVTATLGDRVAHLTVHVQDTAVPAPVTLDRDILPILTRAGCNAGACHGKAR